MAEPNELPASQRNWSMAVIWVALAMAVLDTSIANVALPTLARELHATASESIWVINAYQLGMVAVLLPLAACSEKLRNDAGRHDCSLESACSVRPHWPLVDATLRAALAGVSLSQLAAPARAAPTLSEINA